MDFAILVDRKRLCWGSRLHGNISERKKYNYKVVV